MLSKPIFGAPKPTFHYEILSTAMPQPVDIALPSTITLLLAREVTGKPTGAIKVGNRVKTGQKLTWNDEQRPAVISSATGTIRSIAAYIGEYGRKYTAIELQTEKKDEWDEGFAQAKAEPTRELLADFFSSAPGGAAFEKLLDETKPINAIVVYGGDTDLLMETNLFILKSRIEAVNRGIKIIKTATGIDQVTIVVPRESFQNFDSHFEADVKAVSNIYPAAQPLMVYYQLFGRILEQGRSFEDTGVLFMRTEAVAAVGQAFAEGRVPMEKIVTVLDKQGHRRLAAARIGTPIGSVLEALNITTQDRDRIVFGGPMTGTAVYSEDLPVMPDTDGLMVQDAGEIVYSSDYPCINCGECVRICPAHVPVSMLVRFLEAGQYQDGADLYDLYSCVECGLCGYVCNARIPILQYIKLAKFELARVTPAEEEHE